MIIISLLSLSSNVNPSVLNQKLLVTGNIKVLIESAFLNDVAKLKFELSSKDPHEGYDTITNNFLKVVNKHAPLKKKTVRGNDAPFMNKDFRAIYTRTRLKNKFLKNPSEQNELMFKKQRNICVSLRKKSIKNHLRKITEKGITTNKDFWNFIKPFFNKQRFYRQF